MSKLYRLISSGDKEGARNAQGRVNQARDVQQSMNMRPASAYSLLRARGVDVGVPRLPWRPLNEGELEIAVKKLKALDFSGTWIKLLIMLSSPIFLLDFDGVIVDSVTLKHIATVKFCYKYVVMRVLCNQPKDATKGMPRSAKLKRCLELRIPLFEHEPLLESLLTGI